MELVILGLSLMISDFNLIGSLIINFFWCLCFKDKPLIIYVVYRVNETTVGFHMYTAFIFSTSLTGVHMTKYA